MITILLVVADGFDGPKLLHTRRRARLCLDGEKVGEKVTSVTVAHCSIFCLFVVNIVLS